MKCSYISTRPKGNKLVPGWVGKIISWRDDLLHLVFPETCLACDRELVAGSLHLCPFCEADLKYTYFEKFAEPSSLDKLFWGRVQLHSTCALLEFEKASGTQGILHAIKYKGKKALAVEMGSRFGQRLLVNPEKYGSIDALIPVPLHPKKRFARGYNQSELIAEGIFKSTSVPVITDLLTKGVHTESQTRKGRFRRWDNVSDVFHANAVKYKVLKHIALIDDVVTTGATLESCIRTISVALPDTRITVLSLAVTK